MSIDIRNGDCLKLMKTLPDKSIDLMICDLPYGETNCKWDTCIDLDEFWTEFKRIRKSKKVACIHFCSTKFGINLINSNPKMFKMDMVWKKRNKTGGLQSRYRPMRNHEMVYFFYEQCPIYNRDKYHKRIKAVPVSHKDDETTTGYNKVENTQGTNSFEPPNPASVVEDNKYVKGKNGYGYDKELLEGVENFGTNGFEPPNPASVVEEEEKTTNGFSKEECLKSRKSKFGENGYEPPNPGSIVEEEETDIYGETKKARQKRRETDSNFKPPNPGSVLEEDPNVVWGYSANKKWSEGYEPKLPLSVLEEDTLGTTGLGECMGGKKYGDKMKEKGEKSLIGKPRYNPELPVSIVEEKKVYKGMKNEKYNSSGYNKQMGSAGANFDPQLPGSIVEDENKNPEEVWGWDFKTKDYNKKYGDRGKEGFEPVLPISILDNDNELDVFDFIENPEEAPFSVYESKKVFIGKRNHQTEKPLDILEFFLKYWSNENDTILDPTMGSGSVGVACAKLERNFIGFELDEKIYKKAEKRIKDKK